MKPMKRSKIADWALLLFNVVLVVAIDKFQKQDVEKPTLLPIQPRMMWGIVLAGMGLFLSASSGIGGGGILVPIYILVMGIPPSYAIALSNVTILGGAMANTFIYIRRSHPSRDRALIDYDFAVMMEPPTMAGATIGTIVNKNTPVWLVSILLVSVLLLLTLRTFYKGFKRYKQEEKQHAIAHTSGEAPEDPEPNPIAAPPDPVDPEEQTARDARAAGLPSGWRKMPNDFGSSHSKYIAPDGREFEHLEEAEAHAATGGPKEGEGSAAEDAPLIGGGGKPGAATESAVVSPELAEIYAAEKAIPWKYILILPTLFAVNVSLVLLVKLGKIECGAWLYWVITVSPMLLCIGTFLILMTLNARHHLRKEALGYHFVDGDVMWTYEVTLVCACVCWSAGIFAGLFGIGGGVFKAPQMLEMGMLPEVTSATTAFMIFFTSASATISYSALGLVAWDIAPVLFCVGLVFTFGGQITFDWFVTKYMQTSVHTGSYIIFLIAAVLGVSTVLLGYTGVFRMVDTFNSGDPNYVRGTCG